VWVNVEVVVVGRLVVGWGCVEVDIECRMLKKNKQKEVDMCAKKRRC
jgi:hypothetical protein